MLTNVFPCYKNSLIGHIDIVDHCLFETFDTYMYLKLPVDTTRMI